MTEQNELRDCFEVMGRQKWRALHVFVALFAIVATIKLVFPFLSRHITELLSDPFALTDRGGLWHVPSTQEVRNV